MADIDTYLAQLRAEKAVIRELRDCLTAIREVAAVHTGTLASTVWRLADDALERRSLRAAGE